jgi:hypothetical protein
MSAHNQSQTSRLGLSAGDAVECSATGCTRAEFKRNGQYLYVPSTAINTTVTCPDPVKLPIGMHVVIDNYNGGGDFTLDPDSGSSVTVASGTMAIVFVTSAGLFLQFNNAV